jgi:RNA polymerase sigma-70 factor (ECF subfamily)
MRGEFGMVKDECGASAGPEEVADWTGGKPGAGRFRGENRDSRHKVVAAGEQRVETMQSATIMKEDLDRVEFSRLARDHHRLLLVYARSLVRNGEDARELVQEALVAAWKNLNRFDVTKDFGSWLRGIVRNKWRDHCRRSGRRPEFAEEALGELEASLSAWEANAGQSDSAFGALEHCRERLPEAFSQAIDTYYYEGCSSEEAAEKLGITSATIRKRLERARAALRECMNKQTII